MRVIVPFATREPKTRLAPLLDTEERLAFARAMLVDVLGAVRGAGHVPTVLATEPTEVDAPVVVDDRPLTPAVNDVLADWTADRLGVVMADLALVTPAALERLTTPDADLVLAPGRGGGTNALVVADLDFRVDYHGASIRDHRRTARRGGASVVEVDSFRLSTDVDEPADLVEVLLHGDGAARDWLRDHRFELTVDHEERVQVARSGR